MGRCDWEEEGWIFRKKGNVYTKKDMEELFDKLRQNAKEEYGHQEGYSGKINAKSDFNICGVMTRKQFDDAYRSRYKWLDNGSMKTPKKVEDQETKRLWEDAEGKYGDACVVVIKDETRDTTAISGAFIEDKGIVPVSEREEEQYVINYGETFMDRLWERASSIPKAWKKIKSLLEENPNMQIHSIEKSYTYARPKIGMKTKKARLVKTEWWGTSPC